MTTDLRTIAANKRADELRKMAADLLQQADFMDAIVASRDDAWKHYNDLVIPKGIVEE